MCVGDSDMNLFACMRIMILGIKMSLKFNIFYDASSAARPARNGVLSTA